MLPSQLIMTKNEPAANWFPANLPAISHRFDGLPPEDVLRWGTTTYGDDIMLATGFGPSGIVLMHMLSQVRPKTAVFYLQTDRFFPQTIALRGQLAQRFGIAFIEVHSGLSIVEQSRQFGAELWRHNPDLCCRLRKVEPLRRFLAHKKAWITGIRRDQSPLRAKTQIVAWDDANHLLKLSPLAAWTRTRVWDYIHLHNLPYNKLHDEGYASIGCLTCTRAVAPGEDERAGRWAGTQKTECGIHFLTVDR